MALHVHTTEDWRSCLAFILRKDQIVISYKPREGWAENPTTPPGALWREPRDIKSPLTPSQCQSCGSVCLINPPGWKHQLLVTIHWVCDLLDFRKLCLKLSWYLPLHSFYPLVLVLSLRDTEINSLSSSTFLLLSCWWSPKLSSWVFSSVDQYTQVPFLVSQITWHLIPLTMPALLSSLLYDCRSLKNTEFNLHPERRYMTCFLGFTSGSSGVGWP